MGWVVRQTEKRRDLLHAGSNTFWFAVMRLTPERDRFYLCAANWGHSNAEEAVRKVIQNLSERE
jgi:hypothetical protein